MNNFVGNMTGAAELLLDPMTIIWVTAGILWGCIGGALPGMNVTLTLGIALPISFSIGTVEAVIFLIAITVGCNFGNSLPAIVVALPGTPAAVFTAVEGYALHKQGKTGLALGVTFVASVLGQGISAIMFVFLVVPLSGLSYVFLAPELFALYLLGLSALVGLTGKNVIKGVIAVGIGFGIGIIGQDPVSLVPRFTFDVPELRSGVESIPVMLGLLAVSQLFMSFRQNYSWDAFSTSFSSKFPAWREIKPTLRWVGLGTFVGTFLGAIPGVGAMTASAVSYQQAKSWSKTPELFGKGSVEGIAANESAQNAAQSGELIPTLGLGIPGGAPMVLLLGALSLHGLIPGPLLIQTQPELLYGAIIALIGGAAVLLLTGWFISSAILKLVLLDRSAVLVTALGLSVVGAYTLRGSIFDIFIVLVSGALGYLMMRYGYPVAAAALAVILGPNAEASLRRGLLLTDDSWWKFVSRPITAGLLTICVLFLLYGCVQNYREATSRGVR